MKADLIVQGTIVLPGGRCSEGEVVSDNGVITELVEGTSGSEARRTVRAPGSLVLPGVVDAHVHCLSDPNEGIATATRAAASGGVTTIVEMPFDAGAPVNDVETFLRKRERVQREATVDVALLATIRKRGGLDQIKPLFKAGACGFKLSLFETDAERFPQIPDDELLEAFRIIAEVGAVVGVHAENTDIINGSVDRLRSQGRKDPVAHCESRPPVSETEATLRAMELAHAAGARLHIYHVSLPRAIEHATWFRTQGLDVTTETCPHYLLLGEEDMCRLGASGKINPPLRKKKQGLQLWHFLERGKVDLVASDHAPWKVERKNKPDIFDNASGVPGVEMLLPLLYSEGVVAGKLSLRRLVEALCETPADRFGLSPRKGRLSTGSDADLVVLNPQEKWTVDATKLLSSAGWSPYQGMTIQGKISHVFSRGRLVRENTKVTGKAGDGHFLRPQVN